MNTNDQQHHTLYNIEVYNIQHITSQRWNTYFTERNSVIVPIFERTYPFGIFENFLY